MLVSQPNGSQAGGDEIDSYQVWEERTLFFPLLELLSGVCDRCRHCCFCIGLGRTSCNLGDTALAGQGAGYFGDLLHRDVVEIKVRSAPDLLCAIHIVHAYCRPGNTPDTTSEDGKWSEKADPTSEPYRNSLTILSQKGSAPLRQQCESKERSGSSLSRRVSDKQFSYILSHFLCHVESVVEHQTTE